jgi:anhydro-N-acetylmuramic acid kinase
MVAERMHDIASKQDRIILGLMSGTSVDGLDIALCRFSGSGFSTRYEILEHTTCVYTNEQRSMLLGFASDEFVKMEELCIGHTLLSHWHADMINSTLARWNFNASKIDLLATHGQTVRHAPARIHRQHLVPNATLQIGDADHLAYLTGITTVSDFRQKHVAAGGEGAPLAVYGDRILFQKKGEFRILLNIGGISNITVLDGKDGHSDDSLPLNFDTGPGNTLMDQFIRKVFIPHRFDKNGELAASGKVDQQLLLCLKDHDYYTQKPPKTTGPELLSPLYLKSARKHSDTLQLDHLSVLATLNRFTAETIADAIYSFAKPPPSFSVYVSGGGARNGTLMSNLRDCLPGAEIHDFGVLGVHADAKEALFFAALANEFICGNKLPVTDNNGQINHVRLGRLSFPD